MTRVHVVGNLCRDTTLSVPRFPVPGETLVATASRSGLGGKGLNQAVAAARAGAAVVLHAAVGLGEAGTLVDELAGEPRLDLDLVEGPAPTDTSTILVRPDGENLIVSACAAARRFDPAASAALAESVAPGDVLLMQGNLSRAATVACLRGARRRGVLIVLNPSPLWDDSAPDWSDIDLLVANRGEVLALAGAADPEQAARVLVERGVAAVAVTMGARGVAYMDAAGPIRVPATSVEVRDTTGAGDVFCGVLVGLIAQGVDRGAALTRATAAASLSVTRPGALAAVPTAAEIAAMPHPPSNRSVR